MGVIRDVKAKSGQYITVEYFCLTIRLCVIGFRERVVDHDLADSLKEIRGELTSAICDQIDRWSIGKYPLIDGLPPNFGSDESAERGSKY